jgi:hypothetical protein
VSLVAQRALKTTLADPSPIISSTRLARAPRLLRLRALSAGRFGVCLRFQTKNMQQPIFQFGSEPQNTTNPLPSWSHCSSVQERLVTYGSEALDTAEHLGLILGSQKQADALLDHFRFSHGLGSRLGSRAFALRFTI